MKLYRPGNRGEIFPSLWHLYSLVTVHAVRASVLSIATRFSQMEGVASYGCSQPAVCIHTTDHATDSVYTGTGSIHVLIATGSMSFLILKKFTL